MEILKGDHDMTPTTQSRFFLLAVIFILSTGPNAFAAKVADQVQAQYDSLVSFTTSFEQILTNAGTGEQEERTGSIFYKKPEMVRWVTDSPEKEILVVGSEYVWNYFPEEEAAYKYPAREILSSKTMIRFISGQADLEDDFEIENQGREDELIKLKLVPHKPETNLVLAYIWVDDQSWMVKRILLVDFWGNGNELHLNDIQLDVDIDRAKFEFVPPEGVEIKDNTGSLPDQE
ncbi:MAG: LolA family protein [Thermodesulfobacteriota bacterium]